MNSQPSSAPSGERKLPPQSLKTSLELYRKALLLDVVALVAVGNTPETTWSAVVAKMRWIMDFDRAELALLGGNHLPIAIDLAPTSKSDGVQVEDNSAITREIQELATSGSSFSVKSAETEHIEAQGLNAKANGSSPRCRLIFLCKTPDKVHGAIVLTSGLPEAFGHSEIELVGYLAGQLALALERRTHLAQLQHVARELERRESLDILVRSEKLASMGRLAATIAHEINNPLESITNLLYLIKTSEGLSEAAAEYVSTAEGELRRVSEIANQTLRFHKMSPGITVTNAIELFSTVLAIHQAAIHRAGIQVKKPLQATPNFECFEGEIRQVVNNLIGNAIDAMQGKENRLILRSRSTTNWKTGQPGVSILVADTGSGITAETQSRIFDPFYTTKGLEGTGLGLWVSKGIIERHDGSLRLRSSVKASHHGTTFRVFLPLRRADRLSGNDAYMPPIQQPEPSNADTQ